MRWRKQFKLKLFKQEITKTVKLAIPIALGQLGHVLTGMADYTMLGHTNPLEMAGATFATSVFFPIMILGLGFSLGLTPLVAKANGAQNQNKVRQLFGTGLKLNLLIGIALFVVLYFMQTNLHLFNQPQDVIEVSREYFFIISISIIPLMLFQAMKQFVEGLQNTKTPMLISLLSNIINIGLNFIFIFGVGNFEGMGIVGAGIATLISRVLMVLVFLAYFIKQDHLRGLLSELKVGLRLFPYLKEVLKIGLPISTYMFFEVGAFSAATFMMGWIGEQHIVGHQIALSLASMSFVICLGIGSAGSIRSATLLGKKQLNKLRYVAQAVIALGLGLSVVFGIVFFTLRHQLPLLFVSPDEVQIIEYAALMLLFGAVFQFSDSLQVVFQGLLQGIGDVLVPSLIAVAAYWLIGLPSGYFLAFKTSFGYSGIWLGLAFGLTFSAVFQGWRYRYSVKKLKKLS